MICWRGGYYGRIMGSIWRQQKENRKTAERGVYEFPDGEATDFKWVGIDEFIEMFNNEEIVPTVDFGRKEYDLALKIKQK